MEQKETMNKQNEILDLEYEPSEKAVFNEVIEVMRENFIATFIKEDDTSLLMRFVSGQQFRLKIEEVFINL